MRQLSADWLWGGVATAVATAAVPLWMPNPAGQLLVGWGASTLAIAMTAFTRLRIAGWCLCAGSAGLIGWTIARLGGPSLIGMAMTATACIALRLQSGVWGPAAATAAAWMATWNIMTASSP